MCVNMNKDEYNRKSGDKNVKCKGKYKTRRQPLTNPHRCSETCNRFVHILNTVEIKEFLFQIIRHDITEILLSWR